MAGFMSPSLGFASTAGAFITGAAKQANENIEHDRAQEEQLDRIRIARFADSLRQYEDEQKNYKKEKSAYDYALSTTGNKKVAELVLNRYRSDPKVDLETIVENIKSRNEGIGNMDKDYLSPFEQSGTSDLQRKFDRLQQMHGSFRNPNVKGMFNMPEAPTPYGQMANDYFTPDRSAPMAGDNRRTPPITNSPNNVPSSAYGSPDNPATPSGSGPGGMMTSEEYKAWRERTANGTKPEGSGDFSGGAPGATGGVGGGTSGPISVGGKQSPKALPSIADAAHYANEEAFARAWADAYRVPLDKAMQIAKGAQTADKIRADKIAEGEARAGQRNPGDVEFQKDVMKQVANLPSLNERSIHDMNQVISMIESGVLKTGGPLQDVLDNINRLFTPMGVNMHTIKSVLPEWAQMNDPPNADVMRKISTQLTTELTAQAKLAPVSNFEIGYMSQAGTNIATSPKANIYIALSMRELGLRMAKRRELVMEGFSMQNKADAYEIYRRLREFDRWSYATPLVPRFDSKVDSPEKIQAVKDSVPVGGYYMNTANNGVEGLVKKLQ